MNILITGASRGLGCEVAKLLAQRGHRLTLVARNEEQLLAVKSQLNGNGHQVWPADLSHSGPVVDLIKRMGSENFDGLINNAGASRYGALEKLSSADVEQILFLNLTAPTLLSQAFLQLRPSGGGFLANVTSIVGSLPMPGNAAYCAAKAGLSVLTECLHFEARRKNVRILDFRPVSIQTEFHASAGGESTVKQEEKWTASKAAERLVQAIDREKEFVDSPGVVAHAVSLANRLFPRKFLVGLMNRKAIKAKYL